MFKNPLFLFIPLFLLGFFKIGNLVEGYLTEGNTKTLTEKTASDQGNTCIDNVKNSISFPDNRVNFGGQNSEFAGDKDQRRFKSEMFTAIENSVYIIAKNFAFNAALSSKRQSQSNIIILEISQLKT